jgi:membrane-bound lytic murein transglycosylase A
MMRSGRHFPGKLLITVLLITLWGCDARSPLQEIHGDDLPIFTDDHNRPSLISATQQQLVYLESLEPTDLQTIGKATYPNSWLRESLKLFLDILQTTESGDLLNSRIRDNFSVYQAGGREEEAAGEMLVTGYYEPLFAGSMQRRSPFLYPLYKVPDTLVIREDPKTGEKNVGRKLKESEFVPFWTRREIEQQNLLDGDELIYLKDPMDAFLLHVQGSGRISLPDGSVKAIRFAGSNGHEYNSIGKLLVDEGKLALKEVTVPAIRRYLSQHPDELERILFHNPRFIFFTWGDLKGPRGSLGKVLTPGRSIAIDPQSLPVQAPAYLLTRRPLMDAEGNIGEWVPFRRFVLPQDSGAAIKGPGRVDIFWGNTIYAEAAAGNMKEPGRLFFLVKKGYKK